MTKTWVTTPTRRPFWRTGLPDLLALTGGIVPGMSGSPVVQDGRLVGVVTHVFVSEPRRGYCVYAQWMLEKLF